MATMFSINILYKNFMVRSLLCCNTKYWNNVFYNEMSKAMGFCFCFKLQNGDHVLFIIYIETSHLGAFSDTTKY